jgi:hypothetical protein
MSGYTVTEIFDPDVHDLQPVETEVRFLPWTIEHRTIFFLSVADFRKSNERCLCSKSGYLLTSVSMTLGYLFLVILLIATGNINENS